MRITNKSVYINYLGHLENIQNSKMKEETRLTTGKKITGIEEEPERLAEIKILQSKISKNEGYIEILDQTLSEMRTVMDSMENMSNSLKSLRQVAIDATQPNASSTLPIFASQVKSLLEDIIGQANADFNGKTLYSGTATTPASLNVVPPDVATNDLPFELIKSPSIPPDPSNPEGLRVIFKGNNNNRLVNKDSQTTEITNVKSDEIFGTGGYEPQLFKDIISIYNKIKYLPDGNPRGDSDHITATDIADIDTLQKTILDHDQKMTNVIGLYGSKYNRLETISSQMSNENVRLAEIKSIKADADIARTTIALSMDETALQYSLQVGARIMQNSLFDFLA